MKREGWIITVLVIIAVVLGILAYTQYNETKNLNSIILRLEDEKANLIGEKETLITENKELRDKLQLLEEDVRAIYKTCIDGNACKGHYPGVTWYCNNVGDTTTILDASHTCVCDSSCQLNATEIKKN
jgi:hypothetical protein